MIFDIIKNLQLDSNSIVFEIGSHMGFDTEEIYKLSNHATIHGFEPDPRNFAILMERSINNIAKLNNLAVSDTIGTTDFYLSSGVLPQPTGNDYYDNNDWTASSSLYKFKNHSNIYPWCTTGEVVKVNTITLDEYCKSNNISKIDFIWMDVQGAEDLVFKGAQNILEKTKYIYTEYSNDELYEGQKTLVEILSFLPGKWTSIECEGDNVLLKNENLK
jgi:FkbM family methyltransferase